MPLFESTLRNRPYSFVKFYVGEQPLIERCLRTPSMCLPIEQTVNWSIQFGLSETPENEETDGYTQYYLCPVKSDCTDVPSETPLINPLKYLIKSTAIEGETGEFTLYFGDPLTGYVSFDVYNDSPLCGRIDFGDCFTFEIVKEEYEIGLGEIYDLKGRYSMGYTDCFIRTQITCHHSLITYRCNEDSFGFTYPDEVYNRAMIPMYLRTPQMTQESEVYKTSDGNNIKLYERIDEKWNMETDWMPYAWHKPLNIALCHDFLEVRNQFQLQIKPSTLEDSADTYEYQYVKQGDYSIEWMEHDFPHAKGKCQLLQKYPLHLLNSNCK